MYIFLNVDGNYIKARRVINTDVSRILGSAFAVTYWKSQTIIEESRRAAWKIVSWVFREVITIRTT